MFKILSEVVPEVLAPDVAIIGRTKDLSLVKVAASFVALGVLLIGFCYFTFFNSKKGAKVKQPLGTQELTLKEQWLLKNIRGSLIDESPVHEQQIVDIKKPVLLDSKPNRQKKARTFQKYKSIPTRSKSPVGESKTSTIESSDTTSDADAVVAESIEIDPDFLLQEGTYIPCSLTTRFVSDVAGRIQCMINQDVYSSSGRVKLIERGTKAIGIYQSGILQHGMARMHVIWTKLLTPDHKRVNLVDTQVVGRLGEAGIDGRINSHFIERFGGALMISLIKDVVTHATGKEQGAFKKSTININSYENSRDSITSIAERMLESSINIPPTMYKRQGDIVGIEVGKDIDFSQIYSLKVNHGA